MKTFLFALFLISSVWLSGQVNLNPGDQIKSGKLTLMNDEVIQFYRLEYTEDEKVNYINAQNQLPEFLYISSIKSIDTGEKSTLNESEIEQIETALQRETQPKTDSDFEPGFSTFQYKDKELTLQNPAPGKAVVYFVRTDGNGYLINFRHFDYDKFIGKFAGRGFIRYECGPGEHVFWIGASNSSYVKADLEEGKIYIIETIPVTGFAYAQVKIQIADRFKSKDYEKQKKRIFAVLTKNDMDKSPNESDLANQPDYQKEIERGLKIYNKRLEKEQVHILYNNQYFE